MANDYKELDPDKPEFERENPDFAAVNISLVFSVLTPAAIFGAFFLAIHDRSAYFGGGDYTVPQAFTFLATLIIGIVLAFTEYSLDLWAIDRNWWFIFKFFFMVLVFAAICFGAYLIFKYPSYSIFFANNPS